MLTKNDEGTMVKLHLVSGTEVVGMVRTCSPIVLWQDGATWNNGQVEVTVRREMLVAVEREVVAK